MTVVTSLPSKGLYTYICYTSLYIHMYVYIYAICYILYKYVYKCFLCTGVEVVRLSGFRDLGSDLFREANLCCHLTRSADASPAARDTEHLVGAHLYPLILKKTSGCLS